MDYIEITERIIRYLLLRFIVKIEKKKWRGGVCRWSQQWLSNHVSFEGFDSQEGQMHHISMCSKIWKIWYSLHHSLEQLSGGKRSQHIWPCDPEHHTVNHEGRTGSESALNNANSFKFNWLFDWHLRVQGRIISCYRYIDFQCSTL